MVSPERSSFLKSKPETELAWAAGFFDGEGSTIFVPTTSGDRLMATVGQVDRRNLARFQRAVDGIGSIGKARALPRRQPYSHWTAYNRSAMHVIALLSQFLGPAKSEQAFVATHRYMFRLIRNPGPCKRGHVNPPIYYPPSARGGQCAICRERQRSGLPMSTIVRRPAIEFAMGEHQYEPPALEMQT